MVSAVNARRVFFMDLKVLRGRNVVFCFDRLVEAFLQGAFTCAVGTASDE